MKRRKSIMAAVSGIVIGVLLLSTPVAWGQGFEGGYDLGRLLPAPPPAGEDVPDTIPDPSLFRPVDRHNGHEVVGNPVGSDFSGLPDTMVVAIRAPYVNFNKNKGRWEIQYPPKGKGEEAALVWDKEHDTYSTEVTVGYEKMSWTFRINFKDYTTTDNVWVFDHPKGRVIKQSPYNFPLTPNDLTLPEQGYPWKIKNNIPSDVCYVDRNGNGIGYNGQEIKARGKGVGNDISICTVGSR